MKPMNEEIRSWEIFEQWYWQTSGFAISGLLFALFHNPWILIFAWIGATVVHMLRFFYGGR